MIVTHPISIGLLRKLVRLDDETGFLYWLPRHEGLFGGGAHSKSQEAKRWNGRHAGCRAMTAISSCGYFHGPLLGRYYKAHQVVFALQHDRWPAQFLDHINHDRLDNRPINLREVDELENARNSSLRTDNTSGHTGIHFKKTDRKWVARINNKGDRLYLGAFDSLDEAVEARKSAEKQLGFHKNHGRASA